MKSWKRGIVELLANRGIFIYKKDHPNDFTLAQRIHVNLIRESNGVLHIGGHHGQERDFYANLDVRVLWIEASPREFESLAKNLNSYKRQVAKLALLGAEDKTETDFYVASNNGASSSIYDFSENQHNFMGVNMVDRIQLPMKRLDSLVSKEDMRLHPHWVIDVQGAELAVLKGAGQLLSNCNSLYIEAKRLSFYDGGTKWEDLTSFLKENGFQNLWDIGVHSEENVFFIRVRNTIP